MTSFLPAKNLAAAMRRGVFGTLIAVSWVIIAATGLPPGILVLLALAMVGAFLGPVGGWPAGALLGAATAAAAQPWALAPGASAAAVATALLASALLPKHQRTPALGVTLLLAAISLLIGIVLHVSGWDTALEGWRRCATAGAVAGAGAVGTAGWLGEVPRGPRRWGVGAVSLVALAASALRPVAIPHWQGGLDPLPQDPTAMAPAALERLITAGVADAAWAWVSLAAQNNASVQTLRRRCPQRAQGPRLRGWEIGVDGGRQLCEALEGTVTDVARRLAKIQGPTAAAAQRLRGDLLMAAGRLEEADAAYTAAIEQGDPWASRMRVRGWLDRGRGEGAKNRANVADPWQRLWLDGAAPGARSESTLWTAYNETLEFRGVRLPTQVGGRLTGAPGTLLSYYDVDRAHRAMVTKTPYDDAFGVRLPLPPGRRVPRRLRALMRARRGLTWTLTEEGGDVLRYGCGLSDSDGLKPLPAAVCDGDWTEIELHPAEQLSGPLRSIEIHGDFHVAYIRAEAP